MEKNKTAYAALVVHEENFDAELKVRVVGSQGRDAPEVQILSITYSFCVPSRPQGLVPPPRGNPGSHHWYGVNSVRVCSRMPINVPVTNDLYGGKYILGISVETVTINLNNDFEKHATEIDDAKLGKAKMLHWKLQCFSKTCSNKMIICK